MKINKLLLPILTGFLLCGCGSKDSKPENMYEIKEGGTALDLTNYEQAQKLSTKAKAALTAATGVDNIGMHLVVENAEFIYKADEVFDDSVGEFSNHSIDQDEVSFKASGKIDVVANGLQSATQFSELGAYVGLSDVNYDFYLLEDEIDEGRFSDYTHTELSIKGANVNAKAWLKDSKLYGDLSNAGFIGAGNSILNQIYSVEYSAGENVFQDLLNSVFGTLTPAITINPAGLNIPFPILGNEIKGVVDSIDVGTITMLIYQYASFVKDILTVKVYEDGAVGIYVDITKDKIFNIVKNILILTLGPDAIQLTDEDFKEMMPDFVKYMETCNINVAIVINGDGSLNRFGINANVLIDQDIEEYDGETLVNKSIVDCTVKLKTYLKMNYNESIVYPDFTKFVDSPFILGSSEEQD